MRKHLSPLALLALLAFPAGTLADPVAPDAEAGGASAEGPALLADSGDEGGDDAEADATIEEEAEDEDRERDLDLPISISVGTGLSMSAGNLRPNLPETQQDDSLLNSWNFGVGREITDDLSVNVGWGFYKYLTRAGGLNLQREARIQDISISLGYSPVYVIPVADVRISAGLGAVVPISRMSRTSTLRTAISPSLSFSRSFGDFSLSYRVGGSKRFHQFTSPVIDATSVDAIRREGGAEDISANEVAVAGVNTEWSWSNNVSASYRWFKGFSTSLSWGYGRSWGYDVNDCDELSSPNARCGNRIARDSMTGGISASYSFRDFYGISLSATTAQRPKTADNRRVNFPFWDTQTPGLFNTSLSLNFSANF